LVRQTTAHPSTVGKETKIALFCCAWNDGGDPETENGALHVEKPAVNWADGDGTGGSNNLEDTMYRTSQLVFVLIALLLALTSASAQEPEPEPVCTGTVLRGHSLPESATSCVEDSDCTIVRVSGCCSSTRFAVNTSSASCVERYGPGAGCEMVCPPVFADETGPIYSASCVSGVCPVSTETQPQTTPTAP